MSLLAVGVAFLIIGATNQTPGLSNGATLLCFIGFGCVAVAGLRVGVRRPKTTGRPRLESDQDHMEVW